MKLIIYKETEVRVPRAMLSKLFELVTDDEAEPDWQAAVHLVFTDDTRLHQLNRQFRDKDRPTDVLSFNIDDPAAPDATFGEIYISVPTARRQAVEYGLSFSHECARLACHGFLHLFGYDHQTQSDETDMMARQEHYLDRAQGGAS